MLTFKKNTLSMFYRINLIVGLKIGQLGIQIHIVSHLFLFQ
jgi:hypothetical protein